MSRRDPQKRHPAIATIRLEPTVMASLDELVAQQKSSRSEILRDMVIQMLESQDFDPKPLSARRKALNKEAIQWRRAMGAALRDVIDQLEDGK